MASPLSRIPELLHRTLFRTVSLLGPRAQGKVLHRYFDWWHRRPDPWSLATDAYERRKYRVTLDELPEGTYARILEVGCAEGVFTQTLAALWPDAVITGLDVSERALARARERAGGDGGRVRFVHADLLRHEEREPYDLVFCAETLYYIGRGDRLRRASERLRALLAPGGVLVLVHPWPEAERLHGFVDGNPTVTKVAERVERDASRPYAVSVYRADSSRPTKAVRPAIDGDITSK
ncbi:class I SAM-dependent methyltransferase [Nonomuraea longispora]|uniref:class I SAM-dependent methyltransferase n=1 Tax=Nonomuraea longispora TaxID=1848320 RepID=UPI001404ACB1|nr:SAM-dependent methyltransferase [Nonomuraea longispora]